MTKPAAQDAFGKAMLYTFYGAHFLSQLNSAAQFSGHETAPLRMIHISQFGMS